jgi:pre-mRNA-processing factor 6
MQSLQDIKNGQPPAGYIPGLGRGAVGFITRSDIGPSRYISKIINN